MAVHKFISYWKYETETKNAAKRILFQETPNKYNKIGENNLESTLFQRLFCEFLVHYLNESMILTGKNK